MRMRRKKHLDERIGAVSSYLLVLERDIVNVLEAIKDKKYIDFNAVFNNINPTDLEIGCGKGGFICELAKIKKDRNFLAVEMLENVILSACERAKNENIQNVRFLNTGAEYLPRYIKSNSINNIYLNFSTPYPKKTYENRRLTNDRFLSIYKDILVDNGVIFQKTDDKAFFDYSKEKFIENGFIIEDISEKLSNKTIFNVCTEYEKMFIEKGFPIYGLIAKKGK